VSKNALVADDSATLREPASRRLMRAGFEPF
jgi:hypothetical protein